MNLKPLARTHQAILSLLLASVLLTSCSSAPDRDIDQAPIAQESTPAYTEASSPETGPTQTPSKASADSSQPSTEASSPPREAAPSGTEKQAPSATKDTVKKPNIPDVSLKSPDTPAKNAPRPKSATATEMKKSAKKQVLKPEASAKPAQKPRPPVNKPKPSSSPKPPAVKPAPRPEPPVNKPPTEKPNPPAVTQKANQSLASINAMRASKGLKTFKPYTGKCPVYARANGNTLDGKDGPIQHRNVVLFNIPDNDSWLEASYVSGGGVYNGMRGGFLTVYLCDR